LALAPWTEVHGYRQPVAPRLPETELHPSECLSEKSLSGSATKNKLPPVTAIEAPKRADCGPQGEQFAEHAVHGPGGTLTSAAMPGFMAELDRIFAA
jgi:hypothetical protein